MAKETNFPEPPRGHIALLGWDSVNARWQAVAVNGSGLVQVDLADVADRQVNAHGYDGSAWQKLPLLWGYSDRWFERVSDTDATAGTNTLDTAAVPAGYVYVVQGIATLNLSTVVTHRQGLRPGTYDMILQRTTGVGAGVTLPLFPVGIALKEGDTVRARFYGCTAGDDIHLSVVGYKMAIA